MDIARVVRQLRQERDRSSEEVQRLDAALAALNGNSYGKRTSGGTLSAAARARIAAAQRARWAKVRASKSGNGASSPVKGRLSAAGRAKIAKAQRLRWAKQKKSAQERLKHSR
jgi:hypothetical protein